MLSCASKAVSDELLLLNVSDLLETEQGQNPLCSATEDFDLVTLLLSDVGDGHGKPRVFRTGQN